MSTAFFIVMLFIFSFSTSCRVRSNGADAALNAEKEVPSITFTGPFDRWIYTRLKDEFDPKQMSFDASNETVDVEYDGQKFQAEMKLRGAIRFCDSFPHFKVKAGKKNKILDQREFKIVSHGFYPIDKSRVLNAPSCSKLFHTSKPSWYAREYEIYRVAEKLLKYHLKAYKFRVTYADPSAKLKVTDDAFFIEDIDHAATRYGMKEAEIPFFLEYVSWLKLDDQKEVLGATVGKLFFESLATQFQQVRSNNPKLSNKEVSAKLTKFESLTEDQIKDLEKKASKDLDSFKTSVKDGQLQTIKSTDADNIADNLLFQVLIRNTDWSMYGLSPHEMGIKNTKILRSDSQKHFIVPYDFDGAQLTSTTEQTSETYVEKLIEMRDHIRKNFGDEMLKAIQKRVPDFNARLKGLDIPGLPPHFPKSFNAFEHALGKIDWK